MIKKGISIVQKVFFVLNKQQKQYGVFVLFMSFIGAILELLGVSAIAPFVTVMLEPNKVWNNSLIQEITSLMGICSNSGLIALVSGGIILLYILKNLFFIIFAWVKVKYACKVQRELSVKMMISYMNRGYSFFSNINIGQVTQGINGDVSGVYQVILNIFKVLVEIMTVFFICAYMCYSDWRMALGIIAFASISLVLIYVLFQKKMKIAGIEFRKFSVMVSQSLIQAFYGIKEVIVMRKQHFFVDEFKNHLIKRQKAQTEINLGSEIPAYLIEGLCVSGILSVVCFRVMYMQSPETLVAILATFAVGAFKILPSLGKISSAINSITSSLPGLNSVYENIFEAQKNKSDFFSVKLIDNSPQHENIDFNFKEKVMINNVTFSYSKELDSVLANLSLLIKKGESVGIIGESGAGKSTLADILLGLLVPQTGNILIDETDITTIPDEWSKVIGYVPQSIYLSDASIRNNIAFGVRNEDINENKVWDALDKAMLRDFVNTLPDGINTFVGDRGIRLSGGQRQRIAIARALYHEPEILILDEATSALDNETEKAVMSAIESLQGKITLIIIAHRLTTIRNCDSIYEITDGKAVKKDKVIPNI